MRSRPLVLLAAALAACTAANAATVKDVALDEAAASADSCAYTLSWTAVAPNASGAPDGYVVSITLRGAALLTDTALAPPVRIAFARPAAPDSIVIQATVAAIRRGTIYGPASARAVCRGVDVPLPAPDSVQLDSTQILVRASIEPSGELVIAPGDSVRVTTIGYNARGDTVHLVAVDWLLDGSPTLVSADGEMAIHPQPGNSAWVVALPQATGSIDGPLGHRAVRVTLAPLPLSHLHTS